MNDIKVGSDIYELNIDERLRPGVERRLTGTTRTDQEIHSLPIPTHPFWLKHCVYILRWYRERISPKLGSRCVFEPSCSHYAELAFREKGFSVGLKLTLRRLFRCRPGTGGIDLP